MNLERMQEEHEQLRRKLDKEWSSRIVIVHGTSPEPTVFSVCPVCKAVVIDTYDHREWHLRNLQ